MAITDNYSSVEKAAVVFSLLGEDLVEVVLSKLPKDVVAIVQQDVIPQLDAVAIPEDIDAFVLNEIINPSPVVAELDVEDASKDEESTSENIELETDSDKTGEADISLMSEEDLFKSAPLDIIVALICQESPSFQGIIVHFFDEQRCKEIEHKLHVEKGITLTVSEKKTTLFNKMESKLRESFVVQLKASWKKSK